MPIPDLEPHCGSWVICRADTGEGIAELFERANVQLVLDRAKPGAVRVLTAAQYLGQLNARIREEARASKSG